MSTICFSQFDRYKHLAIVSHTRPDGDTIGAALAVFTVLSRRGVNCELLCDSAIPSKFFVLKGVENYKTTSDTAFDAVLLVDCGDLGRAGKLDLNVSHAKTFAIDHHKTTEGFCENMLVKPDYASTCQIVLELMKAERVEVTQDIADMLFTGLMTDTGNFSHTNTDARAFTDAATLYLAGARVNYLNRHIYKLMSKKKLEVINYVTGKLRFFEDGKISLYYISHEYLSENKIDDFDTEGVIDYALSVDGVEIAIGIIEREKGKFKLSLRSVDGIDVSRLAAEFGGGGHAQASGLMLFGDYYDAEDKILSRAKLYV